MPIYRKNAEKYIHRLCNQFLSLYPGCTVGFDRKSNAGNACTRPVGSEHFDIRIGVADLFPVDKNGCPTTKYVDAMPYMKAAEALVHEFSHVGQMLYSKDPVIRLANTVWQYNRDLYQDCYVSDVREIDAERDGFWGLRSHLCDVFGEKHGCNMFDKYVQYDTQGFCGYLIASLGKPCRTEWDFFDMIDSARSEALRQPFWYHDRESYDQGIRSGDMVLRVLANKKWDGAENVISNSCTYEQSCRRILALCAQEDPNVLHGVTFSPTFTAMFL